MGFYKIYFLIKLALLGDVFVWLTLLCAGLTIAFTFLGVNMTMENKEEEEEESIKMIKTTWKIGIPLFLFFFMGTFLIPSKNDLMMMYGGEYLTNTKEIKNLPKEGAAALDKLLTNYLKENKK